MSDRDEFIENLLDEAGLTCERERAYCRDLLARFRDAIVRRLLRDAIEGALAEA